MKKPIYSKNASSRPELSPQSPNHQPLIKLSVEKFVTLTRRLKEKKLKICTEVKSPKTFRKKGEKNCTAMPLITKNTKPNAVGFLSQTKNQQNFFTQTHSSNLQETYLGVSYLDADLRKSMQRLTKQNFEFSQEDFPKSDTFDEESIRMYLTQHLDSNFNDKKGASLFLGRGSTLDRRETLESLSCTHLRSFRLNKGRNGANSAWMNSLGGSKLSRYPSIEPLLSFHGQSMASVVKDSRILLDYSGQNVESQNSLITDSCSSQELQSKIRDVRMTVLKSKVKQIMIENTFVKVYQKQSIQARNNPPFEPRSQTIPNPEEPQEEIYRSKYIPLEPRKRVRSNSISRESELVDPSSLICPLLMRGRIVQPLLHINEAIFSLGNEGQSYWILCIQQLLDSSCWYEEEVGYYEVLRNKMGLSEFPAFRTESYKDQNYLDFLLLMSHVRLDIIAAHL